MQLKKILTNKYVVAGAISIFALGGLLYYEYKRLLNYCISFNRIKVNSVNMNKFDFDLFMNFKNQSALKIDITSTAANIYLNNNFVTSIQNSVPQIIQPESTSVLGFNCVLIPDKVLKILGNNSSDLLLHREKVNIKVDAKIKIKFYFINITVPYVYETNLKDMMTSTPSDSSNVNVGKCK